MSSIAERLGEFAEYKGVKISFLEKELKLSNDSIGKHVRNKSNIGSEVLGKIAEMYPDLNLDWLLVEKGNMTKEYIQEQDISTNANEDIDTNGISWKLKYEEKRDENIKLLTERKDLKDRIIEQKKLIKFLEERVEMLEKQLSSGKASA